MIYLTWWRRGPLKALSPALNSLRCVTLMTTNLKETDYFKTWAIYTVLALVGGFIAGAIVGGVVGAILGVLGVPVKTISFFTGCLGFVIGLVVSYFCFRFTVAKFLVPCITAPEPDVRIAA